MAEKDKEKQGLNCHVYSGSDVFVVGCGSGGALAAALLTLGNPGLNLCDKEKDGAAFVW